MRISSYCGGFTVYEAMICITAVVITSGLIKVFLLPLLDQLEFVNSADQFKDTLRQAKWLVLTKPKSHKININSGFFMLHKKNVGSYQTVSYEKIPEEFSFSANRWPLFSVFGFPYGGSLVTEN